MRRVGSEYVLRTPIGRGSTGEVWSAATVDGDHPVAIKLLAPELVRDQATVARFVQERSILTGLRSSHLVQVHDLVAERDTLAIVMDLVPGVDLRQHLRRVGALAPGLAVELIGQVLSALAVVHRAGIVHRDVKPENILLDLRDAARPRALLSDFGIARIVNDPNEKRPGGLAGTLRYMAPEVARTGDARMASDLYATGVVLYELLAGRPPFTATEPFGLLRAHELEEPEPIPGLPAGLQAVLARLMAKDPALRPASASLARQELAVAAVEVRSWTALPGVGDTDRYDGPTIPPIAGMGEQPTTMISEPTLPPDPYQEPAPVGAGAWWAGSEVPAPARQAAPGAYWGGEEAGYQPAPPTVPDQRPAPVSFAPAPPERVEERRRWIVPVALLGALALVGGIAAAALWPRGGDDERASGPLPAVIGTTAPGSPSAAPVVTESPTPQATTPTPTPTPTRSEKPKPKLVPNVVGLRRVTAVARLRGVGLGAPAISSVCRAGAKPDRVLNQKPAAGKKVSSQKASLTVQDADCRTVPKVTGMNAAAAAAKLRGLGFTSVARLGGGRTPADELVIAQSIQAGTSVLRSTSIVLVLTNSDGGGGGGRG